MYDLVPQSLSSMHTHWGLDPHRATLEDELAAIVRHSGQNWDAKRKLRLLRICKAMCKPETFWELAILLTGTSMVDRLIDNVFGHDKSKKTTVYDLLCGSAPLLAQAQA